MSDEAEVCTLCTRNIHGGIMYKTRTQGLICISCVLEVEAAMPVEIRGSSKMEHTMSEVE